MKRYLDEGKDHKDNDSTEQEGTEEVEVMASLGSPERVESEGNHHNSRQNHSLEDDFSC